MTAPPRCTRCGAPLADAGAGTVCPACLLKLGLTGADAGETLLAPGESDATILASPTNAGDAATVLGTPTAGAPDARTVLAASTRATGAAPTSRASSTPTHIGPYRLVKPLGEGGMGVVYLAEQEEPIRRTVALKLIKLGMDTHEVVARFEAERQALALMDHPNIASVLDAGATPDGRPYFVMEFAPGVPITDYCDAHRLDTRARLGLFLSVCGAIQHAHQKGIIHRDLKPSNVLVVEQDGQPVPKVIDFGIAKATDQRLSEKTMFTQHGMLIGTPEYMSPEQADPAGTGDIDTRSDIYSLGVLLYELLVGSVPFAPTRLREGGYTELIRIIREEEPPKPSTRLTTEATAADLAERRRTKIPSLSQELRGDLDWITLRALEKDRTRRYPSVSEFAADLTRYLNNEPVVARPPSVSYRVQKFVRRNRLAVTAAGLIALAVVTGLIVSSVLYVREGAAKREAVAQKTEAVSQRDRADAATLTATAKAESEARQRAVAEAARKAEAEARDAAQRNLAAAETNLYFNNIDLADREIAVGNIVHADQLLAEAPARLRNWEWQYLTHAAHMEVAAQTTGEEIVGMTFSSDGRRIMTADRDLSLREWDASSLRSVSVAAKMSMPSGSTGAESAWSPDRRSLVTRSAVVAALPTSPASPSAGLRGAASGASLSESFDLWEVRTGRRVLHLDSDTFGRAYPWYVFSADSTRLIVASEDRTAAFAAMSQGRPPAPPERRLRTWDTRTGAELETHWGADNTLPPGSLRVLAGPDGRTLAVAASGEVALFDAETGLKQIAMRNSSGVAMLAFSADGRVLAGVKTQSAGTQPTLALWSTADGAELATLPLGTTTALLAVSPDGRAVALAHPDLTLGVVSVEGKKEIARLSGNTAQLKALLFSPDGRRIVAGDADGRLRAWQAPDAGGPAVLDAGGHGAQAVELIPSIPAIFASVLVGGALKPYMWNLTTGRSMVDNWPDLSTLARPALSANGRRLAVMQNGRAMVFDTSTGRTLATIAPPEASGRDLGGQAVTPTLALSAEGERLAVMVSGAGVSASGGLELRASHVAVYEVKTGATLFSHDGTGLIGNARFSRDARSLLIAVSGTGPGKTEVYDVESGRLRLAIADALSSAFSHDGNLVAVILRGNAVGLADLQTGHVRPLIPRQTDRIIQLAFSPDGTRLAMVQSDGTVKVWETGEGRQVAALRASAGSVVREWVVTGQREVPSQVHSIAFNNDGTQVVRTTVAGDPRGKLIRTIAWDGSPIRR